MKSDLQKAVVFPLGFLILWALTLVGFSGCANTPTFTDRLTPSSETSGGQTTSGSTTSGGTTAGGTTAGGTDSIAAEDFFQQPSQALSKVDLLFVTDTSSSLDQERTAIASGIDQFISALPHNVNLQAAVMLGHISTSYVGKLYQKGSEPFVLSSSSMSPSAISAALTSKFSALPNDTPADGGEGLIYSLTQGLQGANLADSQSKGFFRSDAAIAIVFITDENDLCSRYLSAAPYNIFGSPMNPMLNQGFSFDDNNSNLNAVTREIAAYRDYCRNSSGQALYTHTAMAQALRALQSINNNKLIASGMIYTGQNSFNPTGENEIGYGIRELISELSGLAIDLADPAPDNDLTKPQPARLAAGLGQIGILVNQNLSLDTVFHLNHSQVIASSIHVYVDGLEVPFTYNANLNEVHLSVSNAGSALSTIRIAYSHF